jgi:DNA mismatch repair protein MutL
MIQQKIELLPEHIIDQIKAGEVIERPANIIKELLENSIDAGATKIDITIMDNGMDLIHIKDNGHGIEFDDLPYAFCRHATSKIYKFEDLYSLYTYGFRGEALASVASISKVTCKSKTENTSGKFQIEGPKVIAHEKLETYNHNGSEFFIKDLFFNTPVRIKFLKSKQAEKNQLNKIINAFLLNNPEVSFSIKWDDMDKKSYPCKKEHIDRVVDVIKNDEFIQITNSYNNITLKVFMGKKSNRSNVGKFHYIFLNGRLIVDRRIHNIVLNAAMPMWDFGTNGNYICFLELPPNEIDVNVHPNKTVVKIFQSSNVYSLISSAIKEDLKNLYKDSPIPSFQGGSSGHDFLNFNSSNELVGFNLGSNLKDLNLKTISDDQDLGFANRLTDGHYLLKIEATYYLLNVEKLIINFLEQNLIKNETAQIPLLISEPIPAQLKSMEKANQLDFEIDEFEKSFLLRAIPGFLEHFNYAKTLEALDAIDFQIKKLNKITNINSLIDSPINIFIDLNIAYYLRENIVITLDSNQLNKLFK